MSDFGAIIIFKKKSGSISTADIEKIEAKLSEVISENDFPSNITDGNFAELRGWEAETYCSLITEYYDDEDAEEIREFAIEDDIPDCQRIIELLESSIGSEFEMEARFESW